MLPWTYRKKIAELEEQIEQYQRDRAQLLKVVKLMDHSLEREQELTKRLTKSLIEKKRKK